MIIGAQKCGTTTLAEILRSHTSIVGCNIKEPHFFSETKNWRNAIDDYHSLFKKQKDAIYFEASTTYTFYPHRNLHIWDDIYEYNPEMKFIYLVRNPFDRIRSSYMHAYERGYTDCSFEDDLTKNSFHIDLTRYYTQIFPYIRKFGTENVLIIDFDELINNRNKILSQISEFLSIDENKFSDLGNVHLNKSVGGNKTHHKLDSPSFLLKSVCKFLPFICEKIIDNPDRNFDTKPELNKDHKELIFNMLRLEIIGLQKLINKDLSSWLKISDFEPRP